MSIYEAASDAAEELEQLREIAREHAATNCRKCNHPYSSNNQDGEPVCDDCGWMP